MSIDPGSVSDDAPLAADAEPLAAEPAATPRPARPVLDAKTQMAIGAGVAVAVIAVIGSMVDAFSFTYSGLILILAGAGAAAIAYIAATGAARTPFVAWRDLILAGGTISAILGILFVAELLFDLDHLDTYGGIVGTVASVALAVAGIALYLAATRWWAGGPAAPWSSAIQGGGRPTRLILVGAALVVIGWLGNVTVGFWFLEAGSETTTFILLAALVMRAAGDPDEPLRLPLPPAFIALVLTGVSALIALQHTSALVDRGAGIEDWISQAIYVIGVVVALAGAILGSSEGMRTLGTGSDTPAPTT
jgi:hypothetical protein